MANKKTAGKILGYGTLGTILSSIGSYVVAKAATTASQMPNYMATVNSEDPVTKAVAYGTMIGAALCFVGSAVYQAVGERARWYSITPRGGKKAVNKSIEDIMDSSFRRIENGRHDGMEELLEDLGEMSRKRDVAYDIGVEKVGNGTRDIVRVNSFRRGTITGMTYTDSSEARAYELLETPVKVKLADGREVMRHYKRVAVKEFYKSKQRPSDMPENVETEAPAAPAQGTAPAQGAAPAAPAPVPAEPEEIVSPGTGFSVKPKP